MQAQLSITHEITHVLNSLMETCKDSEQGFRTAAHAFEDFRMKNLCIEFATQRAKFAVELHHEATTLNSNPMDSSSVSGIWRHGWMNVRDGLAGASRKAIIAECERSERLTKAAYERALSTGLLPLALKQLIEEQYFEVKMVHDLFRALERSLAA